jgi:hypothetical protein
MEEETKKSTDGDGLMIDYLWIHLFFFNWLIITTKSMSSPSSSSSAN